jgi:hypothetical protein
MITMIEPPIMVIIKAVKAPHPPPQGGSQVLLAALDNIDGSFVRPTLVSHRS